jgi:hypothetical protein
VDVEVDARDGDLVGVALDESADPYGVVVVGHGSTFAWQTPSA